MGRFNKLLTALQPEPAGAEAEAELTEVEQSSPAQPASGSLGAFGTANTAAQSAASGQHRMILRDQIIRDPHQVRKYFDPDKLTGLAQTIAEEGVLEALAVYELAERPGYYQLVFGERRYRASGLAGLHELPVRVIDQPDAKKLLKLQLIENKHHEDLNPIEEVEAVLALLSAELEQSSEAVVTLLRQMDNDVRRSSHNVMGQPEAEIITKSLEGLNIKWRSFVLNQLPLLKLSDDVLEPIRQGKIEYTKALTIARLPNLDQRQMLLQEAMSQNLSIRSIRERIKQVTAPAVITPSLPKPEVATYVKRLNGLSLQLKQSHVWQDQRGRLDQLLLELEEIIGLAR
jgi:ParB family transcriptional regulator, chromosome partitioning protein